MKKIKVGIIGTGGISAFHAAGYEALENTEIHSVCDINEQRVNAFAKKHDVKNIYKDYREMLSKNDLDAVSICTPNHLHASMSIDALKAGCHVICEKPMAVNADEALMMLDAAKESEKLLMIGFVRRFGNDAQIIKDYIESGFFGDIYYSKVSYLRRNGSPGGWFSKKAESGGGPLIDLGVHVIDLACYLTGNYDVHSVFGATFSNLGSLDYIKQSKGYSAADQGQIFDVEDLASAMIRFKNGSVLFVDTSFSLNIKKGTGSIELFGTKAGARIDPGIELFSAINDYMVDITPFGETALSFSGLFENEIAHFIECVAKGTSCRSPASDGVKLMKIIDAIYRSAVEKREIIL